jgi:vitamin B12 transporter
MRGAWRRARHFRPSGVRRTASSFAHSVAPNATAQRSLVACRAQSPLASPTLTTCHTFEPAGRAGIEWGSLPLVLLFNIGRYARVPTLAELYGISGAVRGNPTLTPEAGVSAELGLRAAAKASSALAGAAIDAFAFVRDVSGLIAYQRASIGYVRPFNLGSARISGIELLAEYTPARFVLFALSATLLDPRNTTRSRPANDVLPYHSRLTLAPRLELKHAFPTAHIDAAKLSVTYFYASSRYADPAGLVVIPEQAALDADAELRFRNFSIRGRIANLFNQTRFDLIGYPLPGRNAYLALEAEW